MEWGGIEENGEVLILMIHRIHELGSEAAHYFLSAPRHEIVVSDFVARRLNHFRKGRQMQEPIATTGDNLVDTGIYMIEDNQSFVKDFVVPKGG